MLITGVRTLTTALAAPALSSSVAGSTATLSWTAPTPTGQSVLAGYRVYKSATLTGTYTQIGGALPPGQLSLTDSLPATQFYKVEAFDQFVTGGRSGGVQCSPGTQINFDPGIYFEAGNLAQYNGFTDFTSNINLMRGLDTGGICQGVFVTFALGQCEGAMNDYSAWFANVQQLLTWAQGLGLNLGIQVNVSGNVGTASVPSYMLNSTTYGQVQSGTGYQGGLFNGASAGSNSGTVKTVRFDVPATAARIAALGTALYNQFGSDIYAFNATCSEIEDFSGYVPQMTSATIVNTFANVNGMFDQLRAGMPKTYLMFSPSYLNIGNYAQMFAGTDRNKMSCGAYDFTNEVAVRSGGLSRANPSAVGFRGGQLVSGVFQSFPGLIDRRASAGGRDFWAHIGPDELGQLTATATVPPARLGDGDLNAAIWPQVQLMQCSHVIVYSNRQTGPRCNATSPSGYTPAANYAGATNANLVAFFAGKTVPATSYPAAWNS